VASVRRILRRRELAVLVGGGLGTGARFGITAIIPGLWATLSVNVVGAYALGYIAARLRLAGRSRAITVPLLGVGFLGAFTTFSSFAVQLLTRHVAVSLAYGLATVLGGLAFGTAGLLRGRRR
jgi:CrcB protein